MTISRFTAIALTIITVFFAWQLSTADYGTTINDIDYIRSYEIGSDVTSRSGLERATIVGETTDRESLDLWMTRFKLYSVDADEHINILALARIKNDPTALDPGFYQYGGAWLYPLGVWFFALSKLGFIEVGSIQTMLMEPDRIDAVYYSGRLFALICVVLAAYILNAAFRRLAGDSLALAGLVIFLFAPATIMYSQLMKPHWYAMVWLAGAFYLLVEIHRGAPLTTWRELLIGVCVGMTYGAVNSYAPFTVAVWVTLALFWRQGRIGPRPLFVVPVIAVIVWLASNPHIILYYDAFRFESQKAADWFEPALSIEAIWGFLKNSVARGFGAAFTAVSLIAAVILAISPGPLGRRLLAIGFLATMILLAALTAGMVDWGNNSRYIPYFVVGGTLLLSMSGWPRIDRVLWVVAALTIVQAVPLMVAYADENDPEHSTRLRMAAEINRTIPAGERICFGGGRTAAPFEIPPFDFARYRINDAPCRYMVLAERQQAERPTPEGLKVALRFAPRFSSNKYRLVFGHVNPQVTLYEYDAD